MTTNQSRPVLALAMGDPCGISPELTAKIIMDADVRAAADVIVIGDRRVLAEGETVAGLSCDCRAWTPGAAISFDGVPVFVDLGHLDPARVTRGTASRVGGTFALANFRAALRLGAAGGADAVTEWRGATWPRVQYSRWPVECPHHEPRAAQGRSALHHHGSGHQWARAHGSLYA
jgi:hypothetical protein